MKNPSSFSYSNTSTSIAYTLLQLAPLIRSFRPPSNTNNQNHWYESFKKINDTFSNIQPIGFPAFKLLNPQNKKNKKQLHEIATNLAALFIAYLIYEKNNETFSLDQNQNPTV